MKLATLLILVLIAHAGVAQSGYWQQEVRYNIDVSLDEKDKSLTGFEKLTYTNNSPDTLRYIWFHLWPNAYKNDRTALTDAMLEEGNTKFYFSGKEDKGYINRLAFKVDGRTAAMEDHPQYIDIIKVILPQPLAPSASAEITTPFHVRLPHNVSRGGWEGSSFQVTQWYPKPAVYDRNGWHPMPYLDQGEFYSEFGSFSVSITVPSSYTVAATGELQDVAEQQLLNEAHASKPKYTNTQAATKTLRYNQDRIHDFAWFADRNFLVDHDTCMLQSGRTVDVYFYYTPSESKNWKPSTAYAKSALRFYSSEVGEYPYSVLSVVQGPASGGGGMEYPTITLISGGEAGAALDEVIAHEIGHNWFYGILASNERDHPWMDEGVNSFYTNKYMAAKYGKTNNFEEVLFQTLAFYKKDQPIETSSRNFSQYNYAMVAYHKTAQWLKDVETRAGSDAFRQAMQEYFRDWGFKHPQPSELIAILERRLGKEAVQSQRISEKGILPGHELKGTKLIFPFTGSALKKYFLDPPKQAIILSPGIGINNYDKFMLGAVVTNYGLPPLPFRFLAAPLYSFHSKTLNGAALLNYTRVGNNGSRWLLGVGGLAFSKNEQLDSSGASKFERVHRLTPHLRYHFSQPPRSAREQWLEAKAFIINEESFSKMVTKSSDNLLYVDSMANNTRTIGQLTYLFADHRVLYPYKYQLQAQGNADFLRLNATAEFFFNYAKGGGLGLRFFAAKFFDIETSNPFSNYIYQPKLLGVTGEEDFTYSNYFLGRTASYAVEGTSLENNGLAAQQISLRDGGLKMRMDAFENVQGRSNDWVVALNFNTSLPNGILPFKLPLKLFFDIGTYAEPWKNGSEASRFLYTGGLQLSLLKNVINVYAPLIYSSDFEDNLKTLPEQNTFLKRLTFSIDFSQLNFSSLTGYNLY